MSTPALEQEIARRKALDPKADPRIKDVQFGSFDGVLAKLEGIRNDWLDFQEKHIPQFDAMVDHVGCANHPDVKRGKLFDETMEESKRQGYFIGVYAECPACIAEKEKARLRRFWAKRGVPNRVIEATFENYEENVEEQWQARMEVEDWSKRGGNFLILFGKSGTGKGHLASACMKRGAKIVTDEVTHRVLDGLFITHADMLTDLRTSYTLHTTQVLLESWQKAPIFVLDEFGLSSGGKDEDPMLYQVLAERHDKRRPTILTSNLTMPEIRERLGARLVDRIAEDYLAVACIWDSYRSKDGN